MTLGEIIKEYRTEHNMSMKDFSNISGISKAYVGLLEKNVHPTTKKEIAPSIEVVNKVAKAIGKDFDFIINKMDGNVSLGNKDSKLPDDAIPYIPGPTVKIPLVGVVNCGTPLFAEDNIEEYIDTPAEDLETGQTYFWLRAKGNSMVNVGIHAGDLLLIRKQDDVDSGDIAVVSINGDNATLKRVIKKENAIILQPENPACETKFFVGEEINTIKIRGRLMKLEKRF